MSTSKSEREKTRRTPSASRHVAHDYYDSNRLSFATESRRAGGYSNGTPPYYYFEEQWESVKIAVEKYTSGGGWRAYIFRKEVKKMVVVGTTSNGGYKEGDDDSQRVCRKLLPGETGERRWEELSYLYAGIILSRGLQTDAFIAPARFHALALDATRRNTRVWYSASIADGKGYTYK